MFQPKYTKYGLDVKDVMSHNGSLHPRVLRVLLTAHLADLQAAVLEKVQIVLMEEISASKAGPDGWTSLRIFPMAKNIIGTANSRVFFGDILSQEK
ncbi:MAG: hypothetical protein LQ346_006957, partial [Caloplaca aetnensis]